MVAGKAPDWLPAGWTEQVKVTNGRKVKCYSNVETGQKFYSKQDVFRYVKMGNVHRGACQPRSKHNKSHSKRKSEQVMGKANCHPEWLPHGWIMELKTRKAGSLKGAQYKIYIDPSTGCKFYSKPDVCRYLETSKCNDGAKSNGLGLGSVSKLDIDCSTGGKSPSKPDISQDCNPKNIRRSTRTSRTKKTGSAHSSFQLDIDCSTGGETPSKPDVSEDCNANNSKRDTSKTKKTGSGNHSMSNPDSAQDCKTKNSKSCRSKRKERDREKHSINNVAVERTSPDELPPGWIKEIKTRKSGNGIKKDPYFIDPASGYIFRSKKDALLYLETGDINRCASRAKKKDVSDLKSTNDEISLDIDSSTGGKSPSKPDVSQHCTPKNSMRSTSKAKKTGSGRSHAQLDIDCSTRGKTPSKPDVSKDYNPKNGNRAASGAKKTGSGKHSMNNVVVEKASPDELPPGWIKQVKTRESANGIRKDPYFIDPASGYIFRSKKDALRYLETGDINRCASKPKKKDVSDLKLTNDEIFLDIDSSTGGKSPSKPYVSQHCTPKNSRRSTSKAKKIGSGHSQDQLDIDCSTGGKTPSKPDVSKDYNPKKGNRGASRTKKTGSDKQSMNNVVIERASTDELPPGWIKEVKTRKYANGIKKDPYFIDPVSGYIFRSKMDALRYLETGDIKRCAIKPKRKDISDVKLSNDEISSPSAVDGKKLKHKRQRFADKKSCEASNIVASETESSLRRQNLPENGTEKHSSKKKPVDSSKSKRKRVLSPPGRSSKRLAGLKPEMLANLDVGEQALVDAACKSTAVVANQSPALALDTAAHEMPQQLQAEPEIEIAHQASKVKEAPSNIEPSGKNEKPLDHQAAMGLQPGIEDTADHEMPQPPGAEPKIETANHAFANEEAPSNMEPLSKKGKPQQHQATPELQKCRQETDNIGGEKPVSRDTQGSYPFGDSWSDPCLDFAVKTLTGAIPVEDNPGIHDYFHQLDNAHTRGAACSRLPEFGPPKTIHNDGSSHFGTTGKHVPVPIKKLPENSSFLFPGNVSLPSCSNTGPPQPSLEARNKEDQQK